VKRSLFIPLFFLYMTISVLVSAQTLGRRYMDLQEKQKETEKQLTREKQIEQSELDLSTLVPLENVIDPQSYIVGPGDQFSVSILTMEPLNSLLLVGPSGDLLIPTVGVLRVSGKTLDEATAEIETFIHNNAYATAKVNASLANVRRFKIQIAGAVANPGFFIVTPVTRLHEIVELAGDFQPFAREYAIRVERGQGSHKLIDHIQYLQNGDLNGDPTFIEGDRIYVPFGNPEKEGVVIRGSIDESGHDIIRQNETLEKFLQRRARYMEDADLESVMITRMKNGVENVITVYPHEFGSTLLQAGDQIDILSERGVSVTGFVQAPGGYYFIPGSSCSDYVAMAGGITVEGDINRVRVKHVDGKVEKGTEVTIRRGDVIVVPQTRMNVLFGDNSILEIVRNVATIVLAYIAATR